MRGDGHVGGALGKRIVDHAGVDLLKAVEIVAAFARLVQFFLRTKISPDRVVELKIAAARVIERPHRLAVGFRKILKEDVEIGIDLRPPRKCSTAGEGIVIFGITWAASHCFFRNLKCASIGWSSGKSSLPMTRTAWCRVWTPANWIPSPASNISQPVRFDRKSKCHQERRNSPSVASFNPVEACRCTTFSISMSSALRSSSAEISPFSSLARASLTRCGRRRLPTSSARKGGFVRCMVVAPEDIRFARIKSFLARHCEEHQRRLSSWPGIAVRRTASLPLAYDPAIHVFVSKKERRGSPGQAR